MDIEYSLISKIIEAGDFDAVAQARITPRFFLDEENLGIFQWVHHHWSEYGRAPGQEAFQHEYPNLLLLETPEPLDYYIGELQKQRKFALITEALDGTSEPLKKGDVDAVIKLLASSLEGLHSEIVASSVELVHETQGDRMDYYDHLAEQTGLQGWPTGFPTMDLATNGLQAGQLVTITGLQKKFKSMVAMCMNIACNRAGARTMFVGFEMSNTEQTTRFDALRAGISLTRLQRGKPTTEERRKLIRMMHADMPYMAFVQDSTSTTTVSAIAARIQEHRPDVVYIDGTYMMDAESPGLDPGSPQALTTITRSLKRLAQRAQVPIVQTTQSLGWKAKRGLTLDSIGYSSSFAQDSDVIFGTEEIKDAEHEIMLRIIASRNCPAQEVRLALDLDHGSIQETADITYAADDEDDGPAA